METRACLAHAECKQRSPRLLPLAHSLSVFPLSDSRQPVSFTHVLSKRALLCPAVSNKPCELNLMRVKQRTGSSTKFKEKLKMRETD